ncbi:hypothetical protein PV326_004912 [Microctonus aethiopoides]|nr:hypothetical protein PV326_004912 [Microctonus aethiopoides]
MGLTSLSTDAPSCTKSVTIRAGNITIKLKQHHQVLINNEEIIKLPFEISNTKIRIASSIFIIINMENGLEIWWDGISRIYINAPPKFNDKTKGLCGTFTANQKDDFLTPMGDIEQSVIPFANKWKTSEQCNDIPVKQFKHTCELNPERYETSKNYCSKIWSDTFSNCHWHVDPQSFYDDCMYDMCACETNIEYCLCPTFAAYAKECAEVDIKILWRLDIDICQLHCPNNQQYQICGNSCTRSCSDITFNKNCREECVEGCNCPDGQTLDVNGECIPIGQCPCEYNGMEFSAGHREIRPGIKSQDLCACAGGLWLCSPATAMEIQQYPAAINLKTICTNTKHLEITNCEPITPRTCRNMHEIINQSPAICRAGCVCQRGYVLDTPSGECVEYHKCPCYHGGKSYRENSTIQENCNTCKCNNGKWNCTNIICPGICSAWGDSHFNTFDDKSFDFQGICDYILAKGTFGNDDSFDITMQNVPCGSIGVTCSKSISLTVGNGENQETITLTRGKSLPINKFKRISIRIVGLFVFLDVPDLGIVVQWDKGTRVYIKLDPKWKGHTKGLCGDYNDNSEDDFKSPSGGIAEVSSKLFANSWKINSYCPESNDIIDTCAIHPERKIWATEKCGILKSELFNLCHSEVDITPFIQRCIFDTCGCDAGGDCECLCTSLAAYAHECNIHGIPIRWRSQELCPIQCDETCSNYSPCMSTCPQETCDNIINLHNNDKHLCNQDACVEGCLSKSCELGYVYVNNSFKECIPRTECKPKCLEIDGIIYYEGDKVSSDECQTCYCSRSKIICNGAPCFVTTIEPTTVLMEESEGCIDGWSAWFNRKSPKLNGNYIDKLFIDIEPLPTMLELLSVINSSRCDRNQMIDIRCRTVDGHKTPKETLDNVDCNLERGLYCDNGINSMPCNDFEVSIFCRCFVDDFSTVSSSNVEGTKGISIDYDNCDINHQYQAHPSNCHEFYQCAPGINGTKFVKKTCGFDMMYNPVLKICDWPNNVLVIRPECNLLMNLSTTMATERCKIGEHWDECAIKCQQTCQYYRYTLNKYNICVLDSDCVAGCVPDDKIITCPMNKYWRDQYSCVEMSDCPCKSHNGESVKPGDVIEESQCERCQCLSNYYTCDKSLCDVTTEKVRLNTENVKSDSKSWVNHTIIVHSTVSPAVPCSSGQFTSLLSNYIAGEVIFNASSSAGDEFAPKMAELSSLNGVKSIGSCWKPQYMDTEQWIDVKLPYLSPVYGVIIQGTPVGDEYVTSYRVLFSQNGDETFSYVLENYKPKIFHGPIDSSSSVRQFFEQPIEAKVIRINPQTWHHEIAIRVDLIGCEDHFSKYETSTTTIAPILTTVHDVWNKNPICDDPMGLDNGIMVEEQVVASSTLDNLIPNLKLSSSGIWRPKFDNPNQYVEFDFLESRNITGIETKGGDNIWTKAYKVFYGGNKRNWNQMLDKIGEEKIFLANFDDKTVKINYFDEPISARFLKIQPIKWHNHVGLKAEVRGCFIPYPENQILPIGMKEIKSSCNVCHEIFERSYETNCQCDEKLWWNGEKCVEKQQCPCVVDQISYAVGTTFETGDCQKCLCAMGGAAVCQFKTCDPCKDLNTRSVLTELCGCVCKPCPDNMKLCRTSNVCINESLWCNNVKDCPDDETNCEVKSTAPVNNADVTSHTVIEITTIETKNVTKIQCETPVCPNGYKLKLLKKSSPTKMSYHSSSIAATKGGIKGGKRGQKYQRIPKQSRTNDHHNVESKPNDFECQQFSCAPIKPPPPIFENEIKPIKCPQVQCPPNYLEKHCEIRHQPCIQVLAITIDNDVIVLHPDMHVTINEYEFSPKQVNHLGDRHGTFRISKIGNIIHFVCDKYGFWLIWDENSNVKIGIKTQSMHEIDGLCGYFDGNINNDRQKPDGTQAITSEDFGNSWTMDGTPECKQQTCPRHIIEQAHEICDNINDRSFAVCNNIIDKQKYLSRCLETTCMCINSNITKENCRCRALNSFATDCQAANSNIDLSTWRNILNCPMNCPAPFIYKDCFRNKCEMSCDNLLEIDPCPKMAGVCFSGCFCPDGTIRNGDNCIPASECRDCVCNGFGNSNFINFDKKNFTFTGNCTYVLSRDVISEVRVKNGIENDNTYQILMTNVPCQREICTEAISVIYKGHYLHIEQNKNSKQFLLALDGEAIDKLPYKISWIIIENNLDNDLTLLIPAIQLQVMFYHHNFAFTIRLPSNIFGGAMEGLCGNCNANDEDDFKMLNGKLTDNIDEFGMSWLATGLPQARFLNSEDCTVNKEVRKCQPPLLDANNSCLIILNTELFGQCHNLVDPMPFLNSCYDTLCKNGDLCGDIEGYVRNCRQFGLCPNWRNDNLCPYKCPEDLIYQSCGPSCPDNCDTLNNKDKQKCYQDYVEGCFCPENQVYHNNSCIPKTKCFICDDLGHVEGDIWQPDKCTTCSCNNKVVNCQVTQCPMLETICQENFTPILSAGSENECCMKYLCIPMPTLPTICDEPQQLDCGYGQIMKSTIGPDGCQKFICQCLPPEDCPTIIEPITPEYDNNFTQQGYSKVLNTSGCCPRLINVCKPETCPKPPPCPKHHNLKINEIPDNCCNSYECILPKDICLYTFINNNIINNKDHIVAMNIGDKWQDGGCTNCICEKLIDGNAKVNCYTTECSQLNYHLDNDEFILEEKIIDNQCCPLIERVACKDQNGVRYEINDSWHLNNNDTCEMIKCINETNGIQKKIIKQECNNLCERGYEYVESKDKTIKCCGDCVAVACIVNGTYKTIGEKWRSNDNCINYECLFNNGTLIVAETIERCDEINSNDKENYVIHIDYVQGECCPKYLRTGCRSLDKIYQPGATWKNNTNNCITEICSMELNHVELQRTVEICNKSCEFGWEYEEPIDNEQCCGRCKQIFCIVDGKLHKSGSIWYSNDNCTTYECKNIDDQLIISTSSHLCPDISDCPLADIYNDGCCQKCNLTTLNIQKNCMAEVLELDTTIGILKEKRGSHGICRNLEPIDGLTECHGNCHSSTHFNPISWVQETDCQCCQAIEMKSIIVNLTCEDGKIFLKRIFVPISCSCDACKGSKRPIKGHKSPIKG